MLVSSPESGSVSLPILAECDAVVLGGGFGGLAAALELVQAGRRVMVVEPRTYLGREIAATLRPWLEALPAPPPLIASALQAASQDGAFHLDALKLHLEDRLLAAGVGLLYASVAVGIQQVNGALTGVVIGNKSGRQVIGCQMLIDTSETALVARLLEEPFEPPLTDIAEYRRTLEYDGVAPGWTPGQTLALDGVRATLHAGHRGSDHVLVECALDLPVPGDDPFSHTLTEALARQRTLAFAGALARAMPAFQPAYLSGASYELCGRFTARLNAARRTAAPTLERVTLSGGLPLNAFAGSLSGVWYLNDALQLPENLLLSVDAVAASRWGADVGRALSAHWTNAAAPGVATPASSALTQRLRLELREPASPQRGRPYPRTTVLGSAPPTLREADVLVVGGGSSGATAAITAAREGMRTVLVEMNPGLGGTGTYGGVHSYWFGQRSGFAAQVMQLTADTHIALGLTPPQGVIPKWNIEAKASALLIAARNAGVETLCNAFVIGALVEDGRVCGVAVATRLGVGLLRARVVIDASGDGDVAAFAGADFVYGNERDHGVMWYALAQFARPGLTRNHFTSMVDVSNIEDYTRAILAGRRRGAKGGMHDHGIYVAPRESRHIRGDVVLTLTDQLRQRRWPDVINIAFSNHDVKGHSSSDWLRIGLIPPNLEVEIPYRALTPQGLDGLLVVGKAFSATHDALPAIRMQADLENLGGAAALATVEAVRADVPLRQIDLRRLQVKLVDANVLPPEVLGRDIHQDGYTEAELRAMIDALPVFPLHQYSDMELTDLFTERIPLVELCCAGPQVVPLLEEAHAGADGERRLLLAQMLALVGSAAGVPTLIEAIQSQLQGDGLPERTSHIRYTQLPPDHGAMPEVVHLLYSLGMTADARAVPVVQRVVDLLAPITGDDFHDDRKGIFYYVDAVGYCAERAGTAEWVPLLQQLHACAPLHNQMAYGGFQPDFVLERRAWLELIIGRVLARCGSADGFLVLISYLSDNRALLAEHAHSELIAITGQNYGKDVSIWGRWLEQNAEHLPTSPWRPPTEPMQSWSASQ